MNPIRLWPWVRPMSWLLLIIACFPLTCNAESPNTDLAQLNIEDLMSVKVTSVSRKSERFSDAPAAVYVISSEDIRRSGATCIPDLFRMVPGMQVASINSHEWAVSSRGFLSRFADKMLVLIDGRSVYSPMFSGVWWRDQDLVMDDIERIEVIRGPGATMWGANAVNGVINIITKPSEQTSGFAAAAQVDASSPVSDMRFGGKIGDSGSYRIYAKSAQHAAFVDDTGSEATDSWTRDAFGFRIDTTNTRGDGFTLQGERYTEESDQLMQEPLMTPPYSYAALDHGQSTGTYVLGRWSHNSAGNENQLQCYYDGTTRDNIDLHEQRCTVDFDFQQRRHGLKHDVTWGLGHRYIHDLVDGGFVASVTPPSRTYSLSSAFVQDTIGLNEDSLRVILGTKIEHNSFTGIEIQPSARLMYEPNPRESVWISASRAVRTPSRVGADMRINMYVIPGANNSLQMLALLGNPDIQSEKLTAYEAGYKVQATPRLFLDTALYYNKYSDLWGYTQGTPFMEFSPAPAHLVIPLYASNSRYGYVKGAELSANWRVSPTWQVKAGYTYTYSKLSTVAGAGPSTASSGHPDHTLSVVSRMDLPGNVELDLSVYRVGPIMISDDVRPETVAGYTRTDLRLGWTKSTNRELSIGVRNLFDSRHIEYGASGGLIATEVPRTIYAKMTWRR